MDDTTRESVRGAACQIIQNYNDMDIDLITPNLRFIEDLKLNLHSLNEFLNIYAELFEISFTSNERKNLKTLGDLYALMEYKV